MNRYPWHQKNLYLSDLMTQCINLRHEASPNQCSYITDIMFLVHIKTKERSCQPDFGIIKENLNALLLEQWTGPPDMFTCNDYVMRASHATELFVT